MKTALTILAATLALAPAASAQVPQPPPPEPQPQPAPPAPAPPPPAPTPAAAKISIRLGSGISDHGRVYVIKGQRLVVRGRLKPFVAGQKVLVELRRKGKVVGHATGKVRKSGDAGQFTVTVRPRRSGAFAVRATHKATAAQAAAQSRRVALSAIVPIAHQGSRGPKVRLLQHALARLAFVTSRGGSFDAATGRAVIAFRKTNGMARTPSANRGVYTKLFAGKGGFKLRYPGAGKHVEFDWSRQVLVLASGGKPERIYHASSGKPSTPTVFGTFSFYSKTPGTNAKGMVDSNYFIRGYAIHGYPEVPTYAASHGCIRVPIPNAASIFRWINLGDRIFVYR
jgi:lipoprotein-anchoring transpeptidase ErfK/SrfK